MQRNGLSEDDALLRIRAQMSAEEKIPKCDYVIENNSSLEDLKTKTEELLSNIR